MEHCCNLSKKEAELAVAVKGFTVLLSSFYICLLKA